LATSVTFTEPGKELSSNNFNRGNGYGGGKGKGKGKNSNRKGNQNQGGGNRNYNTNQHQFASKANTTGTAFGNTISSWSNVQCLLPSPTDVFSIGNSSSQGVLGSHPNAVCQICFALGHITLGCPQCYFPSPNFSIPAFATFSVVDANELVWYPDLAAASHITPNEGNLHSKNCLQ